MIRRDRTKRTPANPTYGLALSSRRETESFGHTIGRLLHGGHVLALIGELGAGKTALVRGIAAGLGTPTTTVSSPSFSLVQQYQARWPLIHIDLYRLRSLIDAESIGLADCFNDQVVTAVEWADRFPTLLPDDRLVVRLTHRTPTTRHVMLETLGPQSASLLTQIRKAWLATRPVTRPPQHRLSDNRKATRR